MPSPQQQFGTEAELRAAEYLQRKGYRIIDRHVTSRYGEIDILAEEGRTVVAVEVKTRTNDRFGHAIEAVTPAKLKKIAAALHEAVERRGWSARPIRIDLLTIEPDGIDHVVGVE